MFLVVIIAVAAAEAPRQYLGTHSYSGGDEQTPTESPTLEGVPHSLPIGIMNCLSTPQRLLFGQAVIGGLSNSRQLRRRQRKKDRPDHLFETGGRQYGSFSLSPAQRFALKNTYSFASPSSNSSPMTYPEYVVVSLTTISAKASVNVIPPTETWISNVYPLANSKSVQISGFNLLQPETGHQFTPQIMKYISCGLIPPSPFRTLELFAMTLSWIMWTVSIARDKASRKLYNNQASDGPTGPRDCESIGLDRLIYHPRSRPNPSELSIAMTTYILPAPSVDY
ncbi:hypothetical protein K504DRAFT_501628 [Pleomassaria siparia CBS 279.74]|uniref:Uncharacterized protein n=1 Tax=Pleomassaria siparia CBS 279.74 TaxID=1314801 RepID=A0A6G1KBW6_9PLEO|nr:hypothetical protein K504DRAFT_501628 [Pleomassaria siparia CBS 279.74]